MLTEVALAAKGRQRRPPFVLSSCLRAHSPVPKVSEAAGSTGARFWTFQPSLSAYLLGRLSHLFPHLLLHLYRGMPRLLFAVSKGTIEKP